LLCRLFKNPCSRLIYNDNDMQDNAATAAAAADNDNDDDDDDDDDDV